jgi:hypothetical protein
VENCGSVANPQKEHKKLSKKKKKHKNPTNSACDIEQKNACSKIGETPVLSKMKSDDGCVMQD